MRFATALVAAVALASCTGGGSTSQINVVPPPGKPGSVAPAQKLTITGVGDSLTAGVQSGGLMGATLPGPLGVLPGVGPIAPPPLGVPPTQENGFFALLWEQANGVDITTMSDPTKSPLPLMTPPGIGGLLAPTTSHVFPIPVSNTCDAKQLPANQFNTALSLRMNPSLNPWDVGIPGQTVHEALFMVGAIGDCGINPVNAPPTFVALNALKTKSLSELATLLQKNPDWQTIPVATIQAQLEPTIPFLSPNKGFISPADWAADVDFLYGGGTTYLNATDPKWSYARRVDMSYYNAASK